MKTRHIFTATLLLVSALCHAQSAMVQKTGKSVFTLTTFKADGSILATTHGAFCGAQGEAIAAFSPFVGASSAVIIDASGKKSEVEALFGVNEMYDICRFRVSAKTTMPLPLAQKAASGKAFAVGYSTKKTAVTPLTVKSVEPFKEKYNYYIFNEEISEELEGCPIVNDEGQLLGLVQRSKTSYDIHSTDAAFYSELVSSGLSLRDPALQKTAIRVALPADIQNARLMLMMLDAASDSMAVVNTVAEYNQLYPDSIDGYAALARYNASRGNLDAATQALDNAVKKAANKDEAYFEYAKQVYNVAIYQPDSVECPWTLNKAAELISSAIAAKDMPGYKHLQAQIAYSQADYATAERLFKEVAASNIASSEVFYEIAQCKTQLGADDKEVLEQLDKAVELCPRPLTYASAPYILARGLALEKMGEPRAALKDYNLYDTLMFFRATHDFYYTRFKCETKIRQYQQALNDIAHAVVLNPGEVTYLAEMAALQLRVGHFEDVLRTCELSMRVTDEYPDIYIVKGVALVQLQRKEEAMEAFRKAAELGDPRGEEYIEKYK